MAGQEDQQHPVLTGVPCLLASCQPQIVPVGPLDTPKRPLSGYNIFFSAERKRILQEVQKLDEDAAAEDDNRSAASSSVASASALSSIPGSYTRAQVFEIPIERDNRIIKSHRKNKNGKSYGSFATIIGKRWKNLDPQTRGYFEERSRMERVHYRSKLKEQKKQRKNLASGMAPHPQDRKLDAARATSTNEDTKDNNSLLVMVASPSITEEIMSPQRDGMKVPTLSLGPSLSGNAQQTNKDSYASSSSSIVSTGSHHDHDDVKDAWNHEMECKKFLMASNLENLSSVQLALEAQMKSMLAMEGNNHQLQSFPPRRSNEAMLLVSPPLQEQFLRSGNHQACNQDSQGLHTADSWQGW